MADRVGKVKIPLRGEKWVSTGAAALLMDVSRRTITRWAEADLIEVRKRPGRKFQVRVINGAVVETEKTANS